MTSSRQATRIDDKDDNNTRIKNFSPTNSFGWETPTPSAFNQGGEELFQNSSFDKNIFFKVEEDNAYMSLSELSGENYKESPPQRPTVGASFFG